MLRSPSGYRMSARPCRRPKAPARMAGMRFASGSTTTTRSQPASIRIRPEPKISLVPTEKVLRKTSQGSRLPRIAGSRKLWWFEQRMTGPRCGILSSPATCNSKRSRAIICATRLTPYQKCSAIGLGSANASTSGSLGSSSKIAFQPANCARGAPCFPLAALSRTTSTSSRTV